MAAKHDDDRDDELSSERKALLLRLSPQLHAELKRWADAEFRSLNAHLEFVLREAVAKRRKGKG